MAAFGYDSDYGGTNATCTHWPTDGVDWGSKPAVTVTLDMTTGVMNLTFREYVEIRREPEIWVPHYEAFLHWWELIDWSYPEPLFYGALEFVFGSICIRGPPVLEYS